MKNYSLAWKILHFPYARCSFLMLSWFQRLYYRWTRQDTYWQHLHMHVPARHLDTRAARVIDRNEWQSKAVRPWFSDERCRCVWSPQQHALRLPHYSGKSNSSNKSCIYTVVASKSFFSYQTYVITNVDTMLVDGDYTVAAEKVATWAKNLLHIHMVGRTTDLSRKGHTHVSTDAHDTWEARPDSFGATQPSIVDARTWVLQAAWDPSLFVVLTKIDHLLSPAARNRSHDTFKEWTNSRFVFKGLINLVKFN